MPTNYVRNIFFALSIFEVVSDRV